MPSHGVFDGSWGRWAIEVTIRRRDYRPLVVCAPDEVAAADRLGLHAVTFSKLVPSWFQHEASGTASHHFCVAHAYND
jgi:hypothetical protein